MNYFARWRLNLIKSIQLQLFIALLSLPILVSWGIPISIMSIFSTLLFTPFLTVFLLASSCIFFCELLHIPNGFFVYSLEIITNIWLFILNYNRQWWLVGFATPSYIVLIGIVICSVMLLHTKHIKTLEMRTLALASFFIIICVALKYFSYPSHLVEKIMYNNRAVTLITHDNQITLIDDGALGKNASFESFITYTFLPELIQKTGAMCIDHLIVRTINKRTFDALTFLSTKIMIKNLYVPWWTGKIPNYAWYSYVKLKKSVSLCGGKIISLSKKRQIFNTKNSFIFIEPRTEKSIRYEDATYPRLAIKGIINSKTIEI